MDAVDGGGTKGVLAFNILLSKQGEMAWRTAAVWCAKHVASFKGLSLYSSERRQELLKLDRNKELQMRGRVDCIFLTRSVMRGWRGQFRCMASAGVAALQLDFSPFFFFSPFPEILFFYLLIFLFWSDLLRRLKSASVAGRVWVLFKFVEEKGWNDIQSGHFKVHI